MLNFTNSITKISKAAKPKNNKGKKLKQKLKQKIKRIRKMKKTNFANGIYIFALVVLSILLVSCQVGVTDKGGKTAIGKDTKAAQFESTQELKKFSSAQEVLDYIKGSQANAQYGGIFYGGGVGIRREVATMAESAAPMAKSADSSGSAGGSAAGYSGTNIQVEGVDEADFVKNDGKYIYTLTQNKLVIVDAFPAEDAKILSETKIDGRPRDMFLNKDRLALFVEKDGEVPVFAQYDFIPRPRYTSVIHIYVYDISNREDPELVKDYNLNGYYIESRMIDDYVYFIVRDDVYYYAQSVDLPVIKQASTAIARPDIYYFDNPEYNYNFNTVASFNLFDENDGVNAKTFMMGYSNAIYASQDNLYITYQKNLPYIYYERHNEDRFYDVVKPLLPADAGEKIDEIKADESLDSYEQWQEISEVLEEMYNSMDEEEKDELIKEIEEAINEFELKQEEERAKTVIHKINIDEGWIEYDAKGEVPGYLLNQFSMDEHED